MADVSVGDTLFTTFFLLFLPHLPPHPAGNSACSLAQTYHRHIISIERFSTSLQMQPFLFTGYFHIGPLEPKFVRMLKKKTYLYNRQIIKSHNFDNIRFYKLQLLFLFFIETDEQFVSIYVHKVHCTTRSDNCCPY